MKWLFVLCFSFFMFSSVQATFAQDEDFLTSPEQNDEELIRFFKGAANDLNQWAYRPDDIIFFPGQDKFAPIIVDAQKDRVYQSALGRKIMEEMQGYGAEKQIAGTHTICAPRIEKKISENTWLMKTVVMNTKVRQFLKRDDYFPYQYILAEVKKDNGYMVTRWAAYPIDISFRDRFRKKCTANVQAWQDAKVKALSAFEQKADPVFYFENFEFQQE